LDAVTTRSSAATGAFAPGADAAGAPLFVPGWASRPAMYGLAVPDGWTVLDPPSFRAGGATLDRYVDWLVDELARRGPAVLAGHSMGGALAVLAAAAKPSLVERLVLVSPAAFPLSKSTPACLRDLGKEILRGRFRIEDLAGAAVRLAAAPRAASRLAHELRSLDLSPEMRAVSAAGVPATVIACSSDTLVTSDHCRRAARLLGAGYREVEHPGGHLWMISDPPALAHELEATLGV
jgi:pimeloyl-ACP methyl ester carboxylesterase